MQFMRISSVHEKKLEAVAENHAIELRHQLRNVQDHCSIQDSIRVFQFWGFQLSKEPQKEAPLKVSQMWISRFPYVYILSMYMPKWLPSHHKELIFQVYVAFQFCNAIPT